MPTKATVQILQVCLNITSSKFSLHPIQIKHLDQKYHVFKANISWKAHLFWITILALSFIVTLFELLSSHQQENKNLFIILYHVFFLLAKISGIICCFVVNQKSNELTQLLNHFCAPSQRFLVTTNEPKRLRHSKSGAKLTLFLTTLLTLLTIFYTVFLPTVIFMVPRLHPVLLITPINCKSLVVRLIAFTTQIFMLTPTCGANCIGISVALIIVNELSTNLDQLW